MWNIRQQAEIYDRLLAERLHQLLPLLLKQHQIEMWLVINGEYNEDPLFATLVPWRVLNTVRYGGLAFVKDNTGGFQFWQLGTSDERLLPYYRPYGQPEDSIWTSAARLALKAGVASVTVNTSSSCPAADGLSYSNWLQLRQSLPQEIPLLSGEDMVSSWLETRAPSELELYPQLYKQSLALIEEVYSPAVIRPGHTTTAEVEWELAQRVHDLGLNCWFIPEVDVQRAGERSFAIQNTLILPGDLVHCDLGISAFGLCIDVQRNLYIGRPGELDVPPGLLAAAELGYQWQNIVFNNFRCGRSGNQVLASSQAERGKLKARCYCHSIGRFGHGTGPCVGKYDNQRLVAGCGEKLLYPFTCYALEGDVMTRIPEWNGQPLRYMTEDTIYLEKEHARWLNPIRGKLYYLPWD